MAFRDESEALRAKCEALQGDRTALERELDDVRRERNRYRRRSERLEAQLKHRPRRRTAPSEPIPSTGAAFLVAGGLVGWLAVASLIVLSAWTGPRGCPRSTQWNTVMDIPPATTHSEVARWSAEVVDVEGREDIETGDQCSIEATLHRGVVSDRILRWRVAVRCDSIANELAVLNSVEAIDGLQSRYAELGVVHLDDRRSFPALLIEDFGSRRGVPELSLDTGLGRALLDYGDPSAGGWSIRLGVDPEPESSDLR